MAPLFLTSDLSHFQSFRCLPHLRPQGQAPMADVAGYRSWLTCLCGGSPNIRLYSLLN